LFIGDIFDSKKDAALNPVRELLDKAYCCMHVELFRNPSQTLMSIECFCLSDAHKPDLIVAYGTGATIAAQIKVVKKVLIKPYYNTSNVLKNMLGEKMKVRIELTTLGKPEFLTITRPMVMKYKHLEIKTMENGYNKSAHSLFFAKDVETNIYKEHMKQFGDAMIVPGESIFDSDGINGIAKFIRGVIEM
jgi:hypothetical protein